jgi:Outer membrane cobalamin receptor protein
MRRQLFRSFDAYRFKRFVGKSYSMFNSLNREVTIGVVTCCVLTFAGASKASAQENVSTNADRITEEQDLSEVTVTASRLELPASQTVKQVTVITRDEIQRAPIQSIQDLLNYSAGVDIQQRGGHGVQADISIRGGSFDQTAILLNGVNLSNPQTGHYSFDIPVNLNDIERIEILHGPSSFVYGASAFSGGINIITKKDPDHKVYGKVQAGGHALWGVEAGGALKSDVVSTQISAGYNSSDGYIANSDYKIFNALWQTRFNVDKSIIDVQAGYNDKRYGANTFYSARYPNQYDETKTYFASIKGQAGGKQLKFVPLVYWDRHYDCFQLIRGDEASVKFNYHRSDVYGANLNLQYFSKLGATSFGAEFRNEGVASTVLGEAMSRPEGKYTKSAERTNISYVLEHTLMLEKFTFSAGLMANYNTWIKGDYKFYPTAGIAYRPLDNVKIFTSWSKATRMPTFTDMYYNTVTHTGNVGLRPEESSSIDLGVKYSNRLFSANITGYIMNGDNVIDWVKGEQKWEAVNHASLDKKGVELDVKMNLHEATGFLYPNTYIQVGYARLDQSGKNISKEQSSSYALNYLRDKFTTKLSLPLYRDILVTNWSFRWQKRMGDYLDYSQDSNGVKTPFPSFSTMDFRVDYKIMDNLVVNLNINNVYDTSYFDMGSIPQAGFWLMGGVSYTLK